MHCITVFSFHWLKVIQIVLPMETSSQLTVLTKLCRLRTSCITSLGGSTYFRKQVAGLWSGCARVPQETNFYLGNWKKLLFSYKLKCWAPRISLVRNLWAPHNFLTPQHGLCTCYHQVAFMGHYVCSTLTTVRCL